MKCMIFRNFTVKFGVRELPKCLFLKRAPNDNAAPPLSAALITTSVRVLRLFESFLFRPVRKFKGFAKLNFSNMFVRFAQRGQLKQIDHLAESS